MENNSIENKSNFDDNQNKLNDDELNDDDKTLKKYKEIKPIRNSVQFENKITISNIGYDNKSFIDDNGKNDFKRSKEGTRIDIIKTGYSDKLKNVLFSVICCNYLFYGFANNLIGSTLPVMRENLKVTNQEILSVFSVRYSCYFIFNFLTIYTYKRFSRQYQYSLGVFFYVSVFFVLPSVKEYYQFLALFGVLGAGNVLMDSIPIVLILEMFGEKSKVYSQIMFVFFAFGGFLGPLVAGQFVPNPAVEEITMNHLQNGSFNINYNFNPVAQYYPVAQFYNIFDIFFHHNYTHNRHYHQNISMHNKTKQEHVDEEIKNSNFYIPFFLIASLFSIVLIIQTLIQWFFPYEKPAIIELKRRSTMRIEPYFPVEELPLTTEEDCVNVEKADTKLPSYYKKSVIFLFCIVLLCFNSIDQTLSLFLSTFLNSRTELKIPQNLQSSFYSYLAITNTIGKLCSLVLIFYLPQKVYLFMNWSMIFIGILLMNFITIDTIYLLKISLLMIGAGISSTYPLIFTLANKRVIITSKTQTIFLIAIVSQMLYLPILFGHFVSTYPSIFNIFLNTFSSIALTTLIIFHFIDLKRTSFLKTTKPEI